MGPQDADAADATGAAPPSPGLDAATAARAAQILRALASPSRLRILARLRQGPCAATELAAAVGLEQSACSHQLRMLRGLGMVVGERRGRSVVYALYDDHVAQLLDQALHHAEHLRPDPPHGARPSAVEEDLLAP